MRCKVCNSTSVKTIFTSVNMHGRHLLNKKDKFKIAQCQKCTALFPLNIKINNKYFSKYYETGYYTQAGPSKDSLAGKILKLITWFSNFRKEKMILSKLNHIKGKVSILDVGCGNGGFLSSLNPTKFTKFGVEVNKEGYELSRQKGLNVFLGKIEDINFGNKKFDAISMWHVLEHINKPNIVFKKLSKIISKNGLIIFQVPNTDSLGSKIGKKYWFHLDSPRHLVLYNTKSVKKLCRLHNFNVVSIINELYDYPLDLFWSIRNSNLRFLLIPIYPIAKLFSPETLTFICKKSK